MAKRPKRTYTMGERLRDLRSNRGMTQKELSKRAGVSAKHISRLETGRQDVSLHTFEQLTYGLRMSPAEFFLQAAIDDNDQTMIRKLSTQLLAATTGNTPQVSSTP